MAGQALLLGILDLTGVVTLGLVYGLTVVLGVLAAIDNPARRSLVTELVDEEDIPNVLSLNTAVMTGSRVFGPRWPRRSSPWSARAGASSATDSRSSPCWSAW